MLSKLRSARQLGIGGLSERILWRGAMALRIAAFELLRRRAGARNLKREFVVPNDSLPQTFLADADALKERLHSDDAISESERKRILSQAELALTNFVDVRGYGREQLQFGSHSWYGYEEKVLGIMINRHDFLIPLCQAYVLTGDDRYATKIRDLFQYWKNSFDVSNLKAHDTPLDAAIRLLNWLWVLEFGVLSLSSNEEEPLRRSIYLQLEYIHAWSSGGGNHLVLEALAVYIFGALFRASPSGRRWYKWGYRTLATEINRQVTPDGLHTEQSTFYHQAVTTHFLKAYLTAVRNDLPLAPELSSTLRKMIRIVHDTMRPDLQHPMLGDGEALTTDDREHWEAKVLLAAGAEFFQDPVFSPYADTLNDSCLWFLGKPAHEIARTVEPPGSTAYADSGLAMLREEDRYLLMDAAPFGDPHFPHHGHSDALSIELCMSGQPLIVDPGGYGYYDDPFRRYFRSTRAHNTLQVDAKEQSETFGVLGYGRLANITLEEHETGGPIEKISGSHTGYKPLLHRREIYHDKRAGIFLIIDWLLGPNRARIESFYHLAPDVTVDLEERTLRTGSCDFSWAIASSAPVELSVLEGSETGEIQGWYAARTREKSPIEVLQIAAEIDPPFVLATAFSERDVLTALGCTDQRIRVQSSSHQLSVAVRMSEGRSSAESGEPRS